MMTLYDFLQKNKDKEVTVYDNAYESETYWYYSTLNERKEDAWDNSLMELAKKLDIVTVDNKESYSASVTCNISDLMERNLVNIEQADLFTKTTIDGVMLSFDSIIAGYTTEIWFNKFVNCLQ